MERTGERTYRCTACGDVILVESDERPVVVIAAQGGKSTERVVSVGQVEVHRCEIGAATPTSGLLARQ